MLFPLAMAPERFDNRVSSDEGRRERPIVRPIAAGKDWSVSEFICDAGPGDRPFEERHDGYTIAAVVEGAFTYRTAGGPALLHPGALLLGNDRRCFECGHDHGVGDRCIAFNFSSELFHEIAAAAAGTSRYEFSGPMLPTDRGSIPLLALIDSIARDPATLHVEEVATRLVETVVSLLSDRVRSPTPPSGRETRRIVDALRHIEAHSEEPIDLAALAAIANFSKYHFLRVFRRTIGVTPYQYLLSTRMRRAGYHLASSSDRVTAIAFENGFADLSTFNGRFRSIFGVSPSAYRSGLTRPRKTRAAPEAAGRKRDRSNSG